MSDTLAGVAPSTLCPSNRYSPLSGRCAPAITLTSVDFPAPLSPTRATTLPGSRSSETSVSALTLPKCLVMPRKRRMGSVICFAPDRRDVGGRYRRHLNLHGCAVYMFSWQTLVSSAPLQTSSQV